MYIPPGMTEQEVLDAIEGAVRMVPRSYMFGSHTIQDIRQECRLFALEALPRFDSGKTVPLRLFLFRHVKNRILNFRRDKFARTDAPCKECAAGRPCGKDGGGLCKSYQRWEKRNHSKATLASTLGVEPERPDEVSVEDSDDTEINELLELIDRKLPLELRSAWLRMRSGVTLPHSKREEIEREIRKILGKEIFAH